ncbi:MAG: hypothetical protein JKX70_02855 [Phycisphaerales bacterium]|nr:hypothetical protein [Phycisphaerales bacterium]
MDTHPMNALRTSISIAAILLAANTSVAVAIQPESTPNSSPGNPEQVQQALAILPRVGTNQVAVMPTLPAVSVAVQPGLTQGEDWLKVLHNTLQKTTAPSTLAEGAFVLSRPGTLVPGPNGLMIFVPNKETQQPGEGPVLLMPCKTLEQLETEWGGQPIEISGEIFTYHNRNQLLISAYRIGTSPAPQTELPENTSPVEPSSLEDDPAVRDLLNELNFNATPSDSNRQAANRKIEPTNQLAQRAQVTTTTTTGLDEGTLILRRPSRMIRNSTGAWVIVFDNDDPTSTDAIDLIVEPCSMLMRLERIAMETGDAGQLLVSGRIYTYKGAHYILPTLMQRVRPQEINSLQ